MAADAQISRLINDFRELRGEARSTVAALNAARSGLGSGLSGAGTGALTFSGGQTQVTPIPATYDPIHEADRARHQNTTSHAAGRAIRSRAKDAKGLIELGSAVASGDPISIIHETAKTFKDFKNVAKIARIGSAGFFGVYEGQLAAEHYGKKEYGSAAATALQGIMMGASVGGPMGAAVAALAEALTFAYERLKPASLHEFLRNPWSSLGGVERNQASAKFESTRQVIQAFRNIYGGGEIRASTINKIIDDGTDEEKLKADVEKIGSNLDKGYAQIGLGNFDKGVGLIRDAEDIDKKYGLLNGQIMMNPAGIYQMLESQRIAVRNFAATMSSRSHIRTGD